MIRRIKHLINKMKEVFKKHGVIEPPAGYCEKICTENEPEFIDFFLDTIFVEASAGCGGYKTWNHSPDYPTNAFINIKSVEYYGKNKRNILN